MLDQAEPLYLPGLLPGRAPHPGRRARVRIAQGQLADAVGWARGARSHGDRRADVPRRVRPAHPRPAPARPARGGRRQRLTRRPLTDVLDAAQRPVAAAAWSKRRCCERSPTTPAATDARARRPGAALERCPAGYARLFLDEGQPCRTYFGPQHGRPTSAEHAPRAPASAVPDTGPSRPITRPVRRRAERAGARGAAAPGDRR